jgi:hypothetical protein
MSYITETTRPLSLSGLYYSAEENVLVVGQDTLPLDRAWVEDRSPWTLVPFDGPNELEGSAVCLNPLSKPIGTPRFHEWAKRVAQEPKVRESTLAVMRQVFESLTPELEVPEISHPGSFGFNMSINEHGHPHLHTAGFCACLGQNPDGHWVESRDWTEGLCEYDWHNIDVKAQAWSLLAGIGHLACLASQEK